MTGPPLRLAVEGGKVFAMNEAVAHGAEIFGKFTAGL